MIDISAMEKKIDAWLRPPFDHQTIEAVKELAKDKPALTDAFYKDLAFGTGGMRGIMGVGTNRINKYTLGKNTQGLANYLKAQYTTTTPKVVIAYDCRHNSKTLGQTVAEIFSANGIEVYLFSELRPTPQLSFAVKHLKAQCGIVLTASHNPPEYNGYKVYWEDGGQIVPPQDAAIMAAIDQVDYTEIHFKADPSKIHYLGEEADTAFWEAALQAAQIPQEGKEHFTIVFTPLHGTSITALPQVLERAGFTSLHIVSEQKHPDGDFPTVISPNPEETEALKMALELAEEKQADMVIGTDPDADRLGIAVRNNQGELVLLNGNQTMLVMTHFLLQRLQAQGKLSAQHAIASTIVSSPVMRKLAAAFDVHLYETLTGFKWIADAINKNPQYDFVGGGEESYGYMVGSNVRDKDAITASLLACEIGVWCKHQGMTFFQYLQKCYQKFGLYYERLISLTKKGPSGSLEIEAMMKSFRTFPPQKIASFPVRSVSDYKTGYKTDLKSGQTSALNLPKSDVLIFTLENDGQIALRPSGTEPKIKFYLSLNAPYSETIEWEQQLATLEKKLDLLQTALGI